MYFLSWDSIVFVKENKYDTAFFIGGFPNQTSGHSYFYVLAYEKNKAKVIFCSDEHIYRFNTDCYDYNNGGYLKIENIDLNNDGLLDLKFFGEKYTYCEGLETGKNRNNSEYIVREKISYVYIQNNNFALKWEK